MNTKKKTFKGLYIGDNHCDSETMKSRIDDYETATLAKLRECLELGVEHQVDYVVFLGDLFNRIDVGGSCRNKVMKALEGPEDGKTWPYRKFICVGNHDIKHNPIFLPDSALGTVLIHKVLENVEVAPEYGLAFAHFTPTLEEDLADGLMAQKNAPIWIAHASIATRKIFGKHVLFGDLPTHEDTKLVVAGHVHFPMEELRSDGTLFINPGNIGRNAATVDNMNRDMQVVLIEHTPDASKIKHQYIKLKSARPASEVFRMEEIQMRKDEATDRKEFTQQVNQITNLGFTGDKYESLRHSGSIKKVEKGVIDVAVKTLREVNDKRKVADTT